MKRDTGVGCIELGSGANFLLPAEYADPNEINRFTECHVYKLNPDGSKGDLLRIDPGFPEGWDNPRKILPGLPGANPTKKEEENMYPPRSDRAEIVAAAMKLMEKGETITSAAKTLNVPLSTLTTWLQKEKIPVSKKQPPPKPSIEDIIKIFEQYDGKINAIAKHFDIGWATARTWVQEAQSTKKQEPETKKTVMGCPFDEPTYNPDLPADGFTAADDEPIPYQVAEALSEHQRVADEVVQLLDSKHRDYGTDNIRKFGSYGVLVRVSDKVERLINLSDRGTEPLFETTEDTWRDIAGYAILALIELREGR